MSVWFEGEGVIACDLARVTSSLGDLGEHYVGVVSRMPGLSKVELVEAGSDHVTIRTNEGLMRRTNIVTRRQPDTVIVELDEEYKAGSRVTTHSHFLHQFTAEASTVRHHVVVSDVSASGVLGFLYRRFGSKRMGKAFLDSYQAYFES